MYFNPPIFRDLPVKYDDVFRLYNDYRCEFCDKNLSETLLCLICGELHSKIWHRNCCDTQRQRYNQVISSSICQKRTSHLFQHLTKCGHPAAVMLDIQSTLIVICLAESYGHWHSLYLDQHGEEDPKLK